MAETSRDPMELIMRTQRAATGLLAETVATVVDKGKQGVTKPDELVKDVAAMASAMGNLASSTVRPLEFLVASQQQLAETMAAFAILQRQLADVMDTAAQNHAAIVQALEMISNPVIGVAHTMRTDPTTRPGRANAKAAAETDAATTPPKDTPAARPRRSSKK